MGASVVGEEGSGVEEATGGEGNQNFANKNFDDHFIITKVQCQKNLSQKSRRNIGVIIFINLFPKYSVANKFLIELIQFF